MSDTSPILSFQAGERLGESLIIGPNGLTVGRKSDNQVVLRDTSISRYHFSITVEGGHYWLNNRSAHGVEINGRIIMERAELQDMDQLGFGSARALISIPAKSGENLETVVFNPEGLAPAACLPPGASEAIVPSPEQTLAPSSSRPSVPPPAPVSPPTPPAPAASPPPASVPSPQVTRIEAPVSAPKGDPTLNLKADPTIISAPAPASGGPPAMHTPEVSIHYLAISSGGNLLQTVPLEMERLVIGREPVSDLFLDDAAVSRCHATLFMMSGPSFLLRDENSGNGTQLNGETIRGQIQVYFTDCISIGPFELTIQRLANPEPGVAPELLQTVGVSPVTNTQPTPAPAVVTGTIGILKGVQFKNWKRLTFGRGEEASPDFVHCPDGSVSKRHAEIVIEDGGYFLCDLKSNNGTYVNGSPIVMPHRLKNFDRIGIGAFEFRFTQLPRWMKFPKRLLGLS